MPQPPRESIGGKNTTTQGFLSSTPKNNAKLLEVLMASVIFLVTIVELISWQMQKGSQAVIVDSGNNYLLFWYPFLSTITIWIFALFFVVKSFRYKSCVYTKVISYLYFFVQSMSIFAYIFQIGLDFYVEIVYPFILFSIVLLTLIKAVRWFLK